MQTQTRTTAALVAALAVGLSGSVQAGQSSRLGVSAVVVHSLRLQVAPRPTALALAANPAGARAAVRTVAAAGGTFYVVGFDVGMNGAASNGSVGLHLRGDGSAAQAAGEVRYHEGRGGAWNRARYGVAVPADAQAGLQVAHGGAEGGEVGVFVADGAKARQVDVVVTVLADAAPSASVMQ
ncbi:MAG: hypothetical protein NVSMB23_09700 [Myxococcales bacterium]